MVADFETRKLAMMESSNKQAVLNTLAAVGLQNVHGYTCPITETLTGREVMKSFVIEVTGPSQLLDAICEVLKFREIRTIDGSYWM